MTRWVYMACLAGVLFRALAAAEPGTNAHWAFLPVRDYPQPSVSDPSWCRTSIDRFILATLDKQKRKPSPRADPATLLRRAAYDLTGLPAEYDQVSSFSKDSGPEAFRRQVDRLLDSPRYGEHWGRHWLDVVRYADTAGETADYPVPSAWRYRNYVIDSFNSDKPYDRFLREQIAGDILARQESPDRYAENVTATGYIAISRRFGFDSENYHHLTLQDTIDTLGQSILGLSLGCARCHAHKFDPVPVTDYYGLYGIFESTRYPFPGSEQKQKHRALAPLVPPEQSQPKWREFENRVASLVRQLEKLKKPVPAAVLRSLDEIDGDFELQAPAAGGSRGVLVPPWVYHGPIAITTDAQSPYRNLHPMGRVGASIPEGTRDYGISQAVRLAPSSDPARPIWINLDFQIGKTSTNQPSLKGEHRFRLSHPDHESIVQFHIHSQAIEVVAGRETNVIRKLEAGRWMNLQCSLDPVTSSIFGTVGKPGDMTPFGPLKLNIPWDGKVGEVHWDAPSHHPTPTIALDNFGIQARPIPALSPAPEIADGGEGTGDTTAERLRKELDELLTEGPYAMAYAVSEGTPRNARIQNRGEPSQAGDEVPRRFLQALGGGTLKEPTKGSGRLELAEWLAAPSNPLTARVMVNRIWQYHFGQGLVATPNDFGNRGIRPSHPELLDHLATRFIKSGWSVKAMHRLIMDSAVYQLASVRQSLAKADAGPAAGEECPVLAPGTGGGGKPGVEAPDYSAFPRRRLGAEELRDSILLASGGLDASPGQMHPFPNPTSWGFTQHGPFAAVYAHQKRSIYVMTQRIRLHPFLALFDGADPNASTAGRRITTVPTQALFFLNDPFVHGSAEQFARGILLKSDSPAEQIRLAYAQGLGRLPNPEEHNEAQEFLHRHRRASDTSTPLDSMAAFARVLFSSNEFLTVD